MRGFCVLRLRQRVVKLKAVARNVTGALVSRRHAPALLDRAAMLTRGMKVDLDAEIEWEVTL